MFGNESEAAIAKVMMLREQLRPYVAKQYRAAAADGTPVMRPLFFDFWNDSAVVDIDDQLMFGPDYLIAPQLNQNTTSRRVYLPALPEEFAWQNIFEEESLITGGVYIVADTPVSGEDFGKFPVYRKVKRTPYPPPPTPPAPPPIPPCNSCELTTNTDAKEHTLVRHIACPTPEECCNMCKSDSQCYSFVWGPEKYTSGQPTCFFLANVTSGVRYRKGRTYGCVRDPTFPH